MNDKWTTITYAPPFDPSVPRDEREPMPVSALYLVVTEPWTQEQAASWTVTTNADRLEDAFRRARCR